jgi:phosphoglycerate dehydrogenase-like enzyme
MTNPITIVYPDADEDESARHKLQFDRLREVAELKIFTGAPESNEAYIDRIGNADGLLLSWNLPNPVLTVNSQLKTICFLGSGAEKFVDIEMAQKNGTSVLNCPGYSDHTVAEHCMALLLASCRHIPQLHNQLQSGIWNQDLPAIELFGKTIGLIGFGGIGKKFSQLCKAFGMRVLVWNRSTSDEVAEEYEIEFCDLPELLGNSDIISLHLTATADTQNMINLDAFNQMKRGCLLINTARAELIVESDLIDALDRNIISAAALDVYHQEPLPGNHPLTGRENVILSPHVAYNTPESTDRLFKIAVDNLIEFFTTGNCHNML